VCAWRHSPHDPRAGLIKVCLAYEHGSLPANLHYTEPNPNSESLKAGVLKARPPAAHRSALTIDPASARPTPWRVSVVASQCPLGAGACCARAAWPC